MFLWLHFLSYMASYFFYTFTEFNMALHLSDSLRWRSVIISNFWKIYIWTVMRDLKIEDRKRSHQMYFFILKEYIAGGLPGDVIHVKIDCSDL